MIRPVDWIIPIGAALVLLATGINARADDLPCPPKHYFCWEAKWAVSHYGLSRVISRARACGWTAQEIEEAKRCLR